jgi:hypothetical protein
MSYLDKNDHNNQPVSKPKLYREGVKGERWWG